MKLPKSYRIFNRNIIKTKNLWLVSVKKKIKPNYRIPDRSNVFRFNLERFWSKLTTPILEGINTNSPWLFGAGFTSGSCEEPSFYFTFANFSLNFIYKSIFNAFQVWVLSHETSEVVQWFPEAVAVLSFVARLCGGRSRSWSSKLPVFGSVDLHRC